MPIQILFLRGGDFGFWGGGVEKRQLYFGHWDFFQSFKSVGNHFATNGIVANCAISTTKTEAVQGRSPRAEAACRTTDAALEMPLDRFQRRELHAGRLSPNIFRSKSQN